MTPQNPQSALETWQERLQYLQRELAIAANASELFSPWANHLRAKWDGPLIVACYANERIGYMPDAHDIAHQSYAAWQSPKYCNQFPFTAESGVELCAAMRSCLG